MWFLFPFLTLHYYYITFFIFCQSPTYRSPARRLGGTAPFFFRSFPYLTYILYHVFKKMSRPERTRWLQRGQRQNNKKKYISPFIISHIFYFVKARSAERPGVVILSLPSLPQFYYITFFNICQGSGRWASPADLLSVFPIEVFQGTTKTADANANALCPKFFFPSFSNYIISHFAMFCQGPGGNANCAPGRHFLPKSAHMRNPIGKASLVQRIILGIGIRSARPALSTKKIAYGVPDRKTGHGAPARPADAHGPGCAASTLK